MKNKKLTKKKYGTLDVDESYYPDGSVKMTKLPTEKNGFPFYFLTFYNEAGQIKHAFEKPNLKLIGSEIFLSGSHICSDPNQNHIDYFYLGGHAKEYCEISTPKLSGSIILF